MWWEEGGGGGHIYLNLGLGQRTVMQTLWSILFYTLGSSSLCHLSTEFQYFLPVLGGFRFVGLGGGWGWSGVGGPHPYLVLRAVDTKIYFQKWLGHVRHQLWCRYLYCRDGLVICCMGWFILLCATWTSLNVSACSPMAIPWWWSLWWKDTYGRVVW